MPQRFCPTFDQFVASLIAEGGASEDDVREAQSESVAAFERAGLIGGGRREAKDRRRESMSSAR